MSELRRDIWELDWGSEITREERFFCLELYNMLKNKKFLSRFLKLIKGLEDVKKLNVAFEMCFYRDILKFYKEKYNGLEKVKNRKFYSRKRTFDICLWNEKYVVIIEAKSFCGFTTKQFKEFKKDKKNIGKFLKAIKAIENENDINVHLIPIASSHYIYSDKKNKNAKLDDAISWNEIADLPVGKKSLAIFQRANKIYKSKKGKHEVQNS